MFMFPCYAPTMFIHPHPLQPLKHPTTFQTNSCRSQEMVRIVLNDKQFSASQGSIRYCKQMLKAPPLIPRTYLFSVL